MKFEGAALCFADCTNNYISSYAKSIILPGFLSRSSSEKLLGRWVSFKYLTTILVQPLIFLRFSYGWSDKNKILFVNLILSNYTIAGLGQNTHGKNKLFSKFAIIK